MSTDDLVDPIAAATDWVKGEVARALVDGAGNASARVSETVDELFAGEGVGKDTHVQALRISVIKPWISFNAAMSLWALAKIRRRVT